jgi:hypothetical protein
VRAACTCRDRGASAARTSTARGLWGRGWARTRTRDPGSVDCAAATRCARATQRTASGGTGEGRRAVNWTRVRTRFARRTRWRVSRPVLVQVASEIWQRAPERRVHELAASIARAPLVESGQRRALPLTCMRHVRRVGRVRCVGRVGRVRRIRRSRASACPRVRVSAASPMAALPATSVTSAALATSAAVATSATVTTSAASAASLMSALSARSATSAVFTTPATPAASSTPAAFSTAAASATAVPRRVRRERQPMPSSRAHQRRCRSPRLADC